MKKEKLLNSKKESYNWLRFFGELILVVLISPILIVLTIVFVIAEWLIKLYEKHFKKD
jgi:hypothetical protein